MSRSSASPLPHLSSAIDARLQLLHRLSATLNSTDRRAAARKLVAQGHPPKGRPRGSQMAPPDRHAVGGCTFFFNQTGMTFESFFYVFMLFAFEDHTKITKNIMQRILVVGPKKITEPEHRYFVTPTENRWGRLFKCFSYPVAPFIWCALMWFDLFGQSVSGFVLINISFRLHEC